jgi:NACalpha-BTF3-like transcription factor
MVAAQANVSEEKAKEALVATNGDIAEAIMRLAQT